jgi:hypothetical protein
MALLLRNSHSNQREEQTGSVHSIVEHDCFLICFSFFRAKGLNHKGAALLSRDEDPALAQGETIKFN